MNTRIIYTNPDNSLSVIHPTPEMFDRDSPTRNLLRLHGIDFANDADIIPWIIEKDVPDGLVHRVVTVDELPSDRKLRNAWIDTGQKVDYDMPKANNLKRDEFRALRVPLLAALDVDYMKADEEKDTVKKDQIHAKKQALRDVTAFQDFTDIEALKAYMPDVLKG